MQKWLISANPENYNHAANLAECGWIDWKKRNNYEIDDIVYIYDTSTSKIMFKTFVEEISSNQNTDKDWVIFRLIEYLDNDDLSLENLRNNGLKNPPQGKAMILDGDLEKYIDNYFKNDLIYDGNHRMWIINADEDAVKLDTFIKHNFVGIGSPFVDLTGKSRDEIRLICGDENEYSKNCLYKADSFVNQIKFGDYIITKDFSNNEYHIGRCSSSYYYSDKMDDSGVGDQFNHCRDVVWLDQTLKRDDVSKNYLNYIETSKSVQEVINDNAKNVILNFYKYNFLNDEKRNLIFFGAPGTGKSFNLNNCKDDLLKKYLDNIENNYERVTFHPDYTYANFVGTYKPVPKEKLIYTPVPHDDSVVYKPIIEDAITYEYVPGPFMRTLVNALKNPYEPFILIIEEINRANVAAVFGDVFQLLDRDEKLFYSEYCINASEDMKNFIRKELDLSNVPEYRRCTISKYLKSLLGENIDKIRIPGNMFIWATMNSADQGVFPMDTAFKRRWDFEYLSINDYGESNVEKLKVKLNDEEYILWNDIRKAINIKLLSFGINEDKLIGPFFAFKEFIDEGEILEDKFKEIFLNKIIMYLFEDAARSKRDVLFNISENNPKNITYSQIREAFNKNGIKIFADDVIEEIPIKKNE